MYKTIQKKHITALLAAMAAASTGFALTTVNDDVAVTGTVIVNDTVTIQPASQAPVTNSTPGGVGVNPQLGVVDAVAGTTQVFTQIGQTQTVTTDVSGGGITLSPNGNVTLAAATGTETSYTYVRGVEVEIYNADQGALAGTVKPGSQKDVGGYVDANGMFVKIADLDGSGEIPLATLQGLTDEALAAVTTVTDLPSAGGNLTVEGTITQGGVNVATVNDVAAVATDVSTLQADVAAHDAAIATNAAGIAANTAAINQEVADRTALIRQEADGSIHIGANSLVTNHTGADGLGNGGVQELYAQDAGGNAIDINVTNGSNLQVNGVNVATVADVAAEATARIAADNALGLRIDAETADRIAADDALGLRIDGETTARIAADDALGLRIDNEAAIRASEDTLIRADIAAEAATRLAADTQLQANIDTETAARIAADNIHDTRLNGLEAEFAQGGRVTNLENRVGTLEGRTAALEGRVGRVERDVRSLRKGIAMAAALQTPIIEPGKNNAVKFGASVYDGEQGLGLGYARRINDSVQVNVDVATGFPETVARGGVNFSF